MKKKQGEQDSMLDPAYWHLLPEERRKQLQAELEDTLEAALDEGEPVEANDKFWNGVRERFLKNVEAVEKEKKKNAKS